MSIFYVAAHALVENIDGCILITKRSAKNDYMPLKWDIPGGTVEVGETVEDALLRELLEETHLNVIPMRPVFVYSNLSQIPNRQTVQIVYLCKYLDGDIVLNPDEHDEYQWINFSDLKKFDCIAFLESFSDFLNTREECGLFY